MEYMKFQIGGTRRGYPRFDIFSVCKIWLLCQICSVCQICAPRVRLAGRRSTVAVDMLARGTAVILILFSLCDEAQAVFRSAGLRLC